MAKIDKQGQCPNCGRNWDDGDVYDNLNRMSVFTHTHPNALKKVAASLGYSDQNKNRFSAVIVHQVDGKTLYECPKMSCRHVFNADTGEEYISLFEYEAGNEPINKQ